EAQWPEILAEINQGGGYRVEILPIESLSFPTATMDRLIEGAVVVSKVYEANFTYKRLGDSQWILQVPFDQSGYQNAQRMVNSTFNMIEKSLHNEPISNWPAIIETLNLHFVYPITLIEQKDDVVLNGESHRLESREVIYDFEDIEEQFYRRISNSPYIIRLGPFTEPVALDYLQIMMMLVFSFLVALAVLFWVYPLWRDLKRLGVSARAFGQGDFSVRALSRKHSVLYRLAGTFNDMADRIQGLISSHKELTNAVSHELRTPIARLRFGMEMLETSTQAEDRNRYIASMNDDIDELDQLVAELLTYARFDRDKPVLEFQRLEIYPWLDEVIRQAKIGMDGLVIDFEIPDHELKYARFDPVLMARALGNLLQNAKRYARSEIKITFSRDNGCYQLKVDDDGPGIPEDERERIFDAFRRLDASRDRGTGGYGLGLSIVQRIIYWHGGEVSVAGSASGGASLIMRWPEEEARVAKL
ncbi:MAG: ATP-binding protein, partial [Gammaproteobacteria bacterium]|nr:ATP-binding protein [Gammaproteobacteria bacterium]MDX2486643.1 ATP-binding protein [Gammaproteobacteria bacterium]